ncbi:MAG: penicillin-binding transpeptidase domain-containing protein, partial [Eubacteriales bacterium]|nr:penicillin-binding transpeptidase domain-containing protein [Eubacteriales bacterium]
NGVYVAYAPVDNPEIAIAVIVEQAGQGSTAGAPVAEEMFKAYFNLDVEP